MKGRLQEVTAALKLILLQKQLSRQKRIHRLVVAAATNAVMQWMPCAHSADLVNMCSLRQHAQHAASCLQYLVNGTGSHTGADEQVV